MRVVGYLVVLALITGHAVQTREAEKLGVYFGQGLVGSSWLGAGILALTLAGYAAAILILTSQRVRLDRSVLPIAIGTGTLAAVAVYAQAPFQAWGPHGWLWLLIVSLGLPLLTGFAVARLAAPDTGSGISPAVQGCVAGLCATGTTVLLVAALASVTTALFPHKVPLETPFPNNGHCLSCVNSSTVIPPNLRHEYRIGATIDRVTRGTDAALLLALYLALLPATLGAWLGELSLGTGNRRPAAPSAPSQTEV